MGRPQTLSTGRVGLGAGGTTFPPAPRQSLSRARAGWRGAEPAPSTRGLGVAFTSPPAGDTPPQLLGEPAVTWALLWAFSLPTFDIWGPLLYFNACFYGNIYGTHVTHKTPL